MGMVGCFAAVDPETLRRLRNDPALIDGYLHPDDGDSDPPNYIDVDKAWHGIHYLLSGKADVGAEPLSWAVMGGEEIGDEVGYGPARFLEPELVRNIAAWLPDDSVFKSRFDPQAMERAGIYPEVIWVRDDTDALEYLVENYRELVAFYKSAAERGDGAILWLS
jgi:Domain of unknown function (DUF1877)